MEATGTTQAKSTYSAIDQQAEPNVGLRARVRLPLGPITEGHALFCTLSTSGLLPFIDCCLPRMLLCMFLFSGYSWYNVIEWVVDNPHTLDFGRASWQIKSKVTMCMVEVSHGHALERPPIVVKF